MAGGVDFTFSRPVKPGDTLTAIRSLAELYEKEGRSGPLIFVTVQTDVINEQGDHVMTERQRLIAM